jgi:hypothetical protein
MHRYVPLLKIEGTAVLDRHALVVANDDDFDLGEFPAGRIVGKGAKSQHFSHSARRCNDADMPGLAMAHPLSPASGERGG